MGEYCERVPKIAPDVLRKMAKTFTAEEDIVKLQTVNLAAKLYLTNSKQVQNNTQHQEFIEMDIKLSMQMINTHNHNNTHKNHNHFYAVWSSKLDVQFKYRDFNETGQL